MAEKRKQYRVQLAFRIDKEDHKEVYDFLQSTCKNRTQFVVDAINEKRKRDAAIAEKGSEIINKSEGLSPKQVDFINKLIERAIIKNAEISEEKPIKEEAKPSCETPKPDLKENSTQIKAENASVSELQENDDIDFAVDAMMSSLG